jgi:hypothetical protein
LRERIFQKIPMKNVLLVLSSPEATSRARIARAKTRVHDAVRSIAPDRARVAVRAAA